MSFASRDNPDGVSEGEEIPSFKVVIVPPGDNDSYQLVGDPQAVPATTSDRLAQGMAEAGEAIAEVRRTTGYGHDGLPSGGTSLWWPDRASRVVQATTVNPNEVVAFLTGRIGQVNPRLRITAVEERTRNQVSANAQLRVRGTGWWGVELTIYPTPSANLTVIEMMPRRAWMPQTRRYLAAGVPAITGLRADLEADV